MGLILLEKETHQILRNIIEERQKQNKGKYTNNEIIKEGLEKINEVKKC